LDEIEAVLIQLFEPRLNKQGPKWGDETVEYLQYVTSEWHDDEEDQKPSLSEELQTHTQKILDRIDDLDLQ